MGLADLANHIAQQIDLLNEQMAFSISEIDSEKASGASNACSTIAQPFISLNVGLVKRQPNLPRLTLGYRTSLCAGG